MNYFITHPKLSIITVNLNNALGLRKTIESILNQTYVDYEYVIIDGGSTDGSLEVINEYAEKITYWVSEPDKGIYSAMNKGVLKANGEYCLFLNSGDCLNKDILINVFSEDRKADVLYGNLFVADDKGGYSVLYSNKLTLYPHYMGTLSHQASFIKRELFNIELYNENNKIVSDWEFFIKRFIEGYSFIHLPFIVTVFDRIGIVPDKKYIEMEQLERFNVLKRLYPSYILDDYEELRNYKKLISAENLLLLNKSPKMSRITIKFIYLICKVYQFIKSKS